MSYLKKDAVLAAIKSRDLEHDGEKYTIFEAYLGTDPYSKKPVRMSARNVEKLRKKVTAFFKRLSTGGDFAVLLSPAQSVDARKAIDMLKENGQDISLTECVIRYLKIEKDVAPCTTTVIEAFNRYVEAQEGKSEGQRKAVRTRVGLWVKNFGETRLLSEVTAKEVAEDLEKRLFDKKTDEQKTTYNNHLGYIKTFMRWCTFSEQGYITKSPIADMKPKVVGWRDKEYLSAENSSLLFRYLENRPELATDMADSILSFFCGMRQDEIKRVRLGRSAVVIDLDERFIRVVACKGATKGIQPRVFTIPNTAYAWMQSFDFMDAVMKPNNKFREHLRKIAKAAGVKKLPENCGRHTFCTMFDAAYHDQAKLTAIAGNTEDIRAKHYNGLATEKEGREFFSILPSSSVSAVPGLGAAPSASHLPDEPEPCQART